MQKDRTTGLGLGFLEAETLQVGLKDWGRTSPKASLCQGLAWPQTAAIPLSCSSLILLPHFSFAPHLVAGRQDRNQRPQNVPSICSHLALGFQGEALGHCPMPPLNPLCLFISYPVPSSPRTEDSLGSDAKNPAHHSILSHRLHLINT